MDLNKRLSKQLQVLPLKPGEVAVFELLNAFKKDPSREEQTYPESYQLSHMYDIYDPGANYDPDTDTARGGMVTMEAIKGYQTAKREDGTAYQKPMYHREKLIFQKGRITVRHEDNDIYIYLMRRNDNISNPFRKKNAKGVFKLLSEKRENLDKLHKNDIKYLAQKVIREAEWTERLTIVHALKKSPDTRLHVNAKEDDYEAVMVELFDKADKYPDFVINASNDKAAKIRVQMQNAQSFNIIMYVPESKSWELSMKGGATVKVMTEVQPGQDKFEALLRHFTTDTGKIDYNAIMKELRTILKTTA